MLRGLPLPRGLLLVSRSRLPPSSCASTRVSGTRHASAVADTRPRRRQLGLLAPRLYKPVPGAFLLTSDLYPLPHDSLTTSPSSSRPPRPPLSPWWPQVSSSIGSSRSPSPHFSSTSRPTIPRRISPPSPFLSRASVATRHRSRLPPHALCLSKAMPPRPSSAPTACPDGCFAPCWSRRWPRRNRGLSEPPGQSPASPLPCPSSVHAGNRGRRRTRAPGHVI